MDVFLPEIWVFADKAANRLEIFTKVIMTKENFLNFNLSPRTVYQPTELPALNVHITEKRKNFYRKGHSYRNVC